MENHLKKVTDQKIGEISMEDYMAEMLAKAEKREIDFEFANIQIRGYQQLNNRHRNIIDAQRVEIKMLNQQT